MKGNVAKEIGLPGAKEALSIELTTQCNGSCLHCFARSGISRRSSLPFDLAKGIVDEGYNAGYRHLHITGGEPLLWEGLFELLDHAFDEGYETILMNTNGTLITEEISKRLADYGSFSISISLDGPEDLHDRIRGKGSYRKAMRGIDIALNAGNNLIIFTTVTKSLLPELPRFADDLYKKFPSVKYLILIQLISITNGEFPLSNGFPFLPEGSPQEEHTQKIHEPGTRDPPVPVVPISPGRLIHMEFLKKSDPPEPLEPRIQLVILTGGDPLRVPSHLPIHGAEHDVAFPPSHPHPHSIHHPEEPVVKPMIGPIGGCLFFRVHRHRTGQSSDARPSDFLPDSPKKPVRVCNPRIRAQKDQNLTCRTISPAISPHGNRLPDPLGILYDGVHSRPGNLQRPIGAPTIAHHKLNVVDGEHLRCKLGQHPREELFLIESWNDNADRTQPKIRSYGSCKRYRAMTDWLTRRCTTSSSRIRQCGNTTEL